MRLAAQTQFIPLQNVVYFTMSHFLVCKIFTFYINDVLKFKYPVPGPKGLNEGVNSGTTKNFSIKKKSCYRNVCDKCWTKDKNVPV